MVAAIVFLRRRNGNDGVDADRPELLGFTMSTCIVSFIIGLVLFTAGLYGKIGTAEDIRQEEAFRHGQRVSTPAPADPLTASPQPGARRGRDRPESAWPCGW